MDDRKTFLLEMYRQMFADINRHMTVIWQSVSVVIGAFALFALAEKGLLPLDVSVSIIVLLCAWLYAHMLDAGYWYNRNLVIIANIERQFLLASDQSDIQFYFGAHRSKKNKMIKHIRIQASLGIGLFVLAIVFHFLVRVLPGMKLGAPFDLVRILPYVIAVAALYYCYNLAKNRDEAYTHFVDTSPGLTIDNSSITYGVGHQVDVERP